MESDHAIAEDRSPTLHVLSDAARLHPNGRLGNADRVRAAHCFLLTTLARTRQLWRSTIVAPVSAAALLVENVKRGQPHAAGG